MATYGKGESARAYASAYDDPEEGPTLELGLFTTERFGVGVDRGASVSLQRTGGASEDFFGESRSVEIDIPSGAPLSPTVEAGQTSSGETVIGVEAGFGPPGGSAGANVTTPVEGARVRVNAGVLEDLGTRFRNWFPDAPANWPGANGR